MHIIDYILKLNIKTYVYFCTKYENLYILKKYMCISYLISKMPVINTKKKLRKKVWARVWDQPTAHLHNGTETTRYLIQNGNSLIEVLTICFLFHFFVILFHLFPHVFSLRDGPHSPDTVAHPNGDKDIKNTEDGKTFKVNGQRLKPFFDGFESQRMEKELVDLVYLDLVEA